MADLIEDLDDSGIRFVYFSPENGSDSKMFASKLGLETGWNCHVSLSATGESDYDAAEQNARLPQYEAPALYTHVTYSMCSFLSMTSLHEQYALVTNPLQRARAILQRN